MCSVCVAATQFRHGTATARVSICICKQMCVTRCGLEKLHLAGLSWWPRGKESACQCRRLGRHRFNHLKKEMATHSSILSWEIPWIGAGQATVLGVRRELDTI